MSDQHNARQTQFNMRRWIVIPLAILLMSLGGVALWHGLPVRQTYFTDADTIRTPAAGAPLRDILWQPPQPLPAFATFDEDIYEPRPSADGQTLFFVRGRAGENADLYFARRTSDGWSEPQPLTDLNSDHDDLGPEPSADGTTLYFYSNRPGGLGGYDLWMARRGEHGWQTPTNLGPRVNSPFNDYGPALTPDGTLLYFSSNRPQSNDGRQPDLDAWPATLREDLFHRTYDLYVAPITAQGFGTAEALHALNTPYNEGAPAVSPFGDFLYFASDRTGGYGGFDLYRARRLNDGLLAPENLGAAVNSAAHDMDPGLGLGGFGLYFSSDRLAGEARTFDDRPRYGLYYTTSREVFRHVESIPRDPIPLAAWWERFWPALLWALLALALLLLMLAMLKGMQGRRASLLVKCLLASMLAHLVLLFLLTLWEVTASLAGEFRGRRGPVQIALASTAHGDMLSMQIRGEFTAPMPPALLEDSPARPLETPLHETSTVQTHMDVVRQTFEWPDTVSVTSPPVDVALAHRPTVIPEPTPMPPIEGRTSLTMRLPEMATPLARAESAPMRPAPVLDHHAVHRVAITPVTTGSRPDTITTPVAGAPPEVFASFERSAIEHPPSTARDATVTHRADVAPLTRDVLPVPDSLPPTTIRTAPDARRLERVEAAIQVAASVQLDAVVRPGAPPSIQTSPSTQTDLPPQATPLPEPATLVTEVSPAEAPMARPLAVTPPRGVEVLATLEPPAATSLPVMEEAARIDRRSEEQAALHPAIAEHTSRESFPAARASTAPPPVTNLHPEPTAQIAEAPSRLHDSSTMIDARPPSPRTPASSSAQSIATLAALEPALSLPEATRPAATVSEAASAPPAPAALAERSLRPLPTAFLAAPAPHVDTAPAAALHPLDHLPEDTPSTMAARLAHETAAPPASPWAVPTTIFAWPALNLDQGLTPADDVVGLIHGVITESATGRPLAEARIRLDLIDRPALTGTSSPSGHYVLHTPDMPDVFAVTASRPGYIPVTSNVQRAALAAGPVVLDFSLRPMVAEVILVQEVPEVHHLGDDRFDGTINSQFQRPTEGDTFETRFEVLPSQVVPFVAAAEVRLLVKGVQRRHRMFVNGHLLPQRLDSSPRDGSFGLFRAALDPAWLIPGENTFRIEAAPSPVDIDDFEFVNIQIHLAPAP